MRFIDLQWVSSPQLYNFAVTADRIFRLFGRMLPPLAIVGTVASGLWLIFFDSPQSMISHSTVRGLHLIFGLVILGDGLGRIFRLVLAGLTLDHSWQAWRAMALASVAGPVQIMDWGYWGLLVLMASSGAARVAMERYGVAIPMLSPEVGWGVLHALAAKYFLVMVILRIFVHGTARGNWLLDYLKQP